MMRQAIIDYLKANLPEGWRVSSEIPWNESAQSLTSKNHRVVYVDRLVENVETAIPILGSATGIQQSIDSVTATVTIDAKNSRSNTDQALQTLIQASKVATGDSYFQQEVEHTSNIEGDEQQHEFIYEFTKIL